MPTVTAYLDGEIHKQLKDEAEKRKVSQSKIIIESLKNHFNGDSPTTILDNTEVQRLREEVAKKDITIESKDSEIRIQDERIKDLQTQLGFMQNEYSRLHNEYLTLNNRLLPPGPTEKKWYQFWRK